MIKESPAVILRADQSQGRAVETTRLYSEGLTPETIAEIKQQKATNNYRTIAGRAWRLSTFSESELKNAGLI